MLLPMVRSSADILGPELCRYQEDCRRGGQHDVTEMPKQNMIDISSRGVIGALNYRPSRNDGIVVPRLLDIMLHAYDKRKAQKDTQGMDFITDAGWVRWMIDDRMDIQPLKVDIDQYHSLNHQLFNCNVKAKLGNVDTIYYENYPLENSKTKCNHGNLELMRSLTTTEMFHVLQGAAYALKANFDLIANNERENRSAAYAIGQSNFIRLRRNARIEGSGESYERFIMGLVQVIVKGKWPEKIQKEAAQLREIKERWINANYDGNEIRALELCRILSSIGRLMQDSYEEPKDEEDLSSRFQYKLDEIFRKTYEENRNVLAVSGPAGDDGKFFALIAIAATDTQEGRVWRTNPYPCLRGALIAAECVLGDVYFTLRQTYRWSLRSTYGLAERDLQSNKYIFSRVNLFESELPTGYNVVYWMYEPTTPIETTYDNGFICRPEEKADELLCKIDDVKYNEMVAEVVRDGWSQERFKLYKILTEPNLLTIDFEKDAFLNSRSELVMPDYFDKWINAPMFNARLRLTNGQIQSEKTGDPWNKRIAEGVLKATTESLGYVLGRYYDLRMQFIDDALNIRQQKSQIHAHLSRQKDFSALTHYAIGEDTCPQAGTVIYTFRRVALEIITCYRRLDPELHKGVESSVYTHPNIEYMHLEDIFNMEDLSQLVCYVIDCVFERRSLIREKTEARQILHLIQSMTGDGRCEVLNRTFPAFFRRFLKLQHVKLICDLNVINFLPLLFLTQDNIMYKHRQWSVPMILFDEVVRLIPVEVGAHANRFGFKSFFNYVRFHPGDAYKRQEAGEMHKTFGVVCYRYYINTTISLGAVDVPVMTTKLDTLKVHIAAMCAGLSDSLVYTLPVAHPEKCIVLIIIGDEKLSPSTRAELVVSKYRHSRKHVRGVVSICLDQEGRFGVHTSGVVKHRICEKTILKYKCKVILVKTPGYIFGNDELMTKLLNV
uniref:Outer capsid protein VP2 n=1 Tax=Bluetongue virus TaxID=40051 RepID=A0A2R3U8B3_BTV|nr:VP2 [Bluetongue virus]